MKTAAYFSDFTGSREEEERWQMQLREDAKADCLIGMMSGDFLQNGFPAKESKEDRTQKALEAGVELLIPMSLYASLSSLGIYAFSAARILDKLRLPDTLILETEHASQEQLERIAFLLIANTREFQQRVERYKKEGHSFYEAQARAVGEEMEGGGEIMSSGYNIFAVECIKALKIMYSSIQCICVPRRMQAQGKEKTGTKLSELLEYQLYFSQPHLSDIYGGYEELEKGILANRAGFVDFTSFAETLAGRDKDLPDIRKYFLRLICGVTKSTVSIWRMYDFSPYCSIHTAKERLREILETESRVPLLSCTRDECKLERSKRGLLQLEERAGHIYRLL